MEILLSESQKRIVKWTVYLLRKHLGEQANKNAIHDDMTNCGNLGVAELAKIVNESSSLIKCPYQKAVVNDITELGLWICYKDTAYRDVFFYILDNVLKNAEQIRKDIAPYVKKPEDWHVNVWAESKEITAQQIQKGEILSGTVSHAESIHVPAIQKSRLEKIAKEEIRR